MFNSLTGTITAKNIDSLCLTTINGIEWLLFSTTASLQHTKIGTEIKILTYVYVREDNISLFGFTTEKERWLFTSLLKVDGIGPKAALKALTGWEVDDFIAALEEESVDKLAKSPGLGKKTAQKIILTLKGKLVQASDSSIDDNHNEIVQSLIAMGFDKKLVTKAVKEAQKELSPQASESEIIKIALIKLSS
jgi:Holliday junction DNA helicase RuvA